MKRKKAEEPRLIEFDTFMRPGAWLVAQMKKDEPCAFNGIVEVQKYRVTIETVDESVQVIHERLQKLWDECDNYHHHWEPLKQAAARYGYELQGQQGSKRKK